MVQSEYILLFKVEFSPAPIFVNALTVMLTFVPGSREGIVKFNVVLTVVSNISVTAFIDGTCDHDTLYIMIPFGLTGVHGPGYFN